MTNVLVFITGILLRIGIPLVVTLVVLYFLQRLDKRWQKEAKIIPAAVSGKPCWEINGCSQDQKKNCPAVAQPKIPCWQVFLSPLPG